MIFGSGFFFLFFFVKYSLVFLLFINLVDSDVNHLMKLSSRLDFLSFIVNFLFMAVFGWWLGYLVFVCLVYMASSFLIAIAYRHGRSGSGTVLGNYIGVFSLYFVWVVLFISSGLVFVRHDVNMT